MNPKNNISLLAKEDCCGCTACSSVCPVHAISMIGDDEGGGFLYPSVDAQQCIACGKCLQVCRNVRLFSDEQRIFACRSKNDYLRARSSSGGIFSLLAEKVLESGGGVCAVGYSDDYKECLHKLITSVEGLDDLRRAKFVQSKKYDIFWKVKEFLRTNRTLLFCGTPCEVGGLRQYLGEDHPNLLTCDLICGCTSSPDVYRRYIEFLSECYKSPVTGVNFKDKRQGWREKAIAVTFANGQEYYNSILDDDYCVSFHSRYNIRPSCFRCKYRNLNRTADITLGDFWAIERYRPELDDNKGTSFVLVNSHKGLDWLAQIECDMHEMKIDLENYSTNYNWCMHRNPTGMPDQDRRTFYQDVRTMRFDEMARKDLAEIKQIRKQRKLNADEQEGNNHRR